MPGAGADDDVVDKLGDLAADRRAAPDRDPRVARPRRPRGGRLRAARVAASRRCGPRPASRSRCAPRTRPGTRRSAWRDGYRVIRKAGRYLVFPRAAFSEMMGWHGASDGLVEIWNGMPFFSPVWARRPTRRVAAPRARLDVGDDAAAAARAARPHASSSDVAPPHLPPHADRHAVGVVEGRARRASCTCAAKRITVVPPGHRPVVLARAATRSPTPLVVAVGRLVPVKRFDAAHRRAGRRARRAQPALRAVIVGEGYEREALERADRASSAPSDWISLPGRVDDADAASTSTGGRGCSRARRRTRAGA